MNRPPPRHLRLAIYCILFALAAGCKHSVQVSAPVLPPVPAGPSEYELTYQEGLKAFRLATPEGYQKAVSSFRKASDLSGKTSCEAVLHLAESLYFLAQQQKLNWENFNDTVSEANADIDFKGGGLDCSFLDSYLTRLRTLKGTFAGVRTADSVAMIRHAIEVEPDNPMNWVVLAQVRAAPAPGDSLAPIEHAAELAPDLPLVQYELGNYYLNKQVGADNFTLAKQAFERTLELSPRHFLAMIGITYALLQDGDDAATQTLALLQKAVEIAPNSLRVRTVFGDYYSGFEETEKAVEQYKAATDQNPNYYPGFLSAGVALSAAEETEPSEKAFQTVIQINPKIPRPPLYSIDLGADAQAHYYLGQIGLERGDLKQARSEFAVSLSDIPNYPLALYGLGIVSYQEGKLEEALSNMNQVIGFDPEEYPNAYLVRGGIYADRRQFTESLRDLDRAIEIYTRQSANLKAKAQSDQGKGFKRRAEAERRRASHLEDTLGKAQQTKALVLTLQEGSATKKQPRLVALLNRTVGHRFEPCDSLVHRRMGAEEI